MSPHRKESQRAERVAAPRRVYDRFAARYDCAIAPLERHLLGRLRERALSRLPAEARLLLEIGAGTGLNFPFYPPGAAVVTSEPSREMLARAAAHPKRPAGTLLVRHTVERLPFADGTFDAAFATLVFCSVSSPAEGFAELRRVVRPGGHVLLLEHVRPAGLLGYLFDALTPLTRALCEDHFNRRTALEARRAGLEVLEVERHARGILEIIHCRV